MKKILLIVLIFGTLSSTLFAQSLALSDSTGPIANNTTLTVQGIPSQDEIVKYAVVTNLTADPIPVMVKKVELSMPSGTYSLFCWGLCYDPTVFVSPDPMVINGNASSGPYDFSGHFLPSGIVGMATIRYVFFDQHNPSDSVCMNVNFTAYPLGIHDISQVTGAVAYPNPASGQVHFLLNLKGNQNGTLILRNIIGSTVKEIPISGSSEKLSLRIDDLPNGVYFYSIVSNGTILSTKKLIVKN